MKKKFSIKEHLEAGGRFMTYDGYEAKCVGKVEYKGTTKWTFEFTSPRGQACKVDVSDTGHLQKPEPFIVPYVTKRKKSVDIELIKKMVAGCYENVMLRDDGTFYLLWYATKEEADAKAKKSKCRRIMCNKRATVDTLAA